MITSFPLSGLPSDEEDVLSPTQNGWSKVPEVTLPLEPTPSGSVDPSKYISDTVDQTEIGLVDQLRVKLVHDPDRIWIWMNWKDPHRDDQLETADDFVDKAAVMFPLVPGASVMTMGSKRAPINVWFWRAHRKAPYDVLAQGMGTTERRSPDRSSLQCRANYSGNRWTVVFQRLLKVDGEDFVNLRDESLREVAFAVWAGSNRERGPLKAFSGEFLNLRFLTADR